jgi:hypothetical protein
MEQKQSQLVSFSKTGNYEKHIDNIILGYAIEDPAEEYVSAYAEAKYDLADWLEKFYNFQKMIPIDIAIVFVESRICASPDPNAMLKFSQKFGAKFTPLGNVCKILIGMLVNRVDHAIDYFKENKESFPDEKKQNRSLLCHALVHGHHRFVDYIYTHRRTFPMCDLIEYWLDKNILPRISHIESLYYLYMRCEGKHEKGRDMKGHVIQCVLDIINNHVKENDLQKVIEICTKFPKLEKLIDYGNFMDPVFHRQHIPDDSYGTYHEIRTEYMNEDLFMYLVEKFQPPRAKISGIIDNITEAAFMTKSTKMMKWLSDNYIVKGQRRIITNSYMDLISRYPR